MAPFMRTFLPKYQDDLYALMRVVFGLLFLCHGMSKLFGWPQSAPDAPAAVIYIAGSIELFGGTLVVVGLLANSAAFLCSGLMAVAYWTAHASRDFIPLRSGGELAVLYCFIFLYIAARGAGKWSVDAARG